MSTQAHAAWRDIDADEARKRVDAGEVQVLDVRTPGEYTGLGHIPGAMLLPVDLIASAPATLKLDQRPLLITCEHGVRSLHAARFLHQAGFTNMLNLAGGMATWTGPRDHNAAGSDQYRGPSSWLLTHAGMLPRRGRALDVACGRGRHALLLAAAGLQVDALDRDGEALTALQETARRLGLPLNTRQVDLETGEGPFLEQACYDLVLVTRYLHRPLFAELRAALRPGGLLFYETFTVEQAAQGHPTRPEFLLQPGELEQLVAPLEILHRRQGEHDGAHTAAVVARRSR